MSFSVASAKAARSRNKQASKLPEDQILFWLVLSVHQEPDQGLLPAPEYIEAWALEGLRAYMKTRGIQPGEGQ